jgi:hypothetical protein
MHNCYICVSGGRQKLSGGVWESCEAAEVGKVLKKIEFKKIIHI